MVKSDLERGTREDLLEIRRFVVMSLFSETKKPQGRGGFDRRLGQLRTLNRVTVLCETSHQNCPSSVAVRGSHFKNFR